MKKIILLLLAVLPFFSMGATVTDGGCCSKKKGTAKCTGSANCRACSNCSNCKYCSSGGTCGVCAGGKPKTYETGTTNPAVSNQCQAITKKGSQCSRKARSGRYCWQHGG